MGNVGGIVFFYAKKNLRASCEVKFDANKGERVISVKHFTLMLTTFIITSEL